MRFRNSTAANTDTANARMPNRSARSSELVRKASVRYILRMMTFPDTNSGGKDGPWFQAKV